MPRQARSRSSGQAKSPSLAQDLLALGDIYLTPRLAGLPTAAPRAPAAVGGAIEWDDLAGDADGAESGGSGGEPGDGQAKARLARLPPPPFSHRLAQMASDQGAPLRARAWPGPYVATGDLKVARTRF